ncbi:MAG: S-layer homology domain-containing protein, partial [Clostridia bacterium]|nr:S-layer homology domain-containing protein [Clostridia bacterium]
NSITQNFTMPTSGSNGTTISWVEKTDTGSNITVSGDTVTVTRPSNAEGDKTVTITATIAKENGTSETKDISVTIKAYTVAEEADTAIAADKAALDATDFTYSGSDDQNSITQNFTLPTSGSNGTTISWVEKTDTGSNITVSGDTVTVVRPAHEEGDKIVTITAIISKEEGVSETKDIDIIIKASDPITYTVTYDENGASGGSVPTDENLYEQGSDVIVLGNTGTLIKPGYQFTGWNTQADGHGTDFAVAGTFTMGDLNVLLYAKWIANADLSSVNLSNGVLSPDFDKDVISYSASVAYSTTSITISPTLNDEAGSITVNGESVNSGQISDAIALAEGNNIITIVTTAIDNTTQKTYTLTITRETNTNQYTVSGDLNGIISDGTNPLGDVTVRVMKGGTNGTQFGNTLITNTQGEFAFSSLPYGTYSLVSTKGEIIKTEAIVIQSASTTKNLTMPAGKQKTLVEVGDGTASTAASNLDDMFTEEDDLIIDGGGEVILKLIVNQKNQEDVASDAILIQGALQNGNTVGAYFDIRMHRTVIGSGGSDVNDETVQPPDGKKVMITIDVPAILRNKAPYQVIRVHNGETAVISATYNRILHTLTFEGDLFSVYSIIYTPQTATGSSTGSTVPSFDDKTLDIVGTTRITPAVIIDKNTEDEIEITLKNTLKEIILDDLKGAEMMVPIIKSANKTTVNISGDTIKALAANESIIVVETPSGSINFMAADIDLDGFKDAEGNPINLNEINVSVVITSPSLTESELTDLASMIGVERLLPLRKTEVILKNGDSIMMLDQFDDYVTQKIDVTDEIEAKNISTAVFIDKKGKINHIPTQISIIKDRYYATVKSIYLGTECCFIWNPIQLPQVENSWSKEAVNDLASRLILLDTKEFEPNKAITRADFAELIVRALGYYREDFSISNRFNDVSNSSAQAIAIYIANKFGIIEGYPDGTFRSDSLITREEAMVMYYRAMKITKMVGTDTNRYKNYTDYEQVGSWASPCVREVLSAHVFNGTTDTTISPKTNLTYAEAIQAIRNLLVESQLINK